jgi:Icc-related predicted phosphoesterase
MKITAISDLHGYYPTLGGGDLLIVAGDLTARDDAKGYFDFFAWIAKTPYKKRIVIAGNHDMMIQRGEVPMRAIGDFEYLEDSGTEFEGFKIWGTPWTKTFYGMNPKCKAFTWDHENGLAEKWAMIPSDTDILITHSPPHGMFDANGQQEMCGSYSLQSVVQRIRPKLHVFGHIHEAYEMAKNKTYGTIFANVSHVNGCYDPVNAPIEIELDEDR